MKTMVAILMLAFSMPCWAGPQDKKAMPVDLIPKAEIPKDGTWRVVAKTLCVDAVFPVREILTFSQEIPEEYDLTVIIERMDDTKKDFAVGLPFGEYSCAYHFDTWDATKNSVALLAGQEGESTPGPTFRKGKSRTAKFSVRKDGLTVELDGRKFWKGKIAWAKATTVSAISVEKSKLFLVASGGQWKVSGFVLAPAPHQ